MSAFTFKDGDIVWVKLSNSWWPAQVCNKNVLGENVTSLKKPLIAVVKFFNEETYEFVKNKNAIFPYNCEKKEQFIKKGLELYRSNNKFAVKFPSDVQWAEKLDSSTFNLNNQVNSQIKVNKQMFGNTFSLSKHQTSMPSFNFNSKIKDTKNIKNFGGIQKGNLRRKSIFLTPQGLYGSDSWPIKTMASFQTQYTPPDIYKCHLCPFSSRRQNVIIMHSKTHNNKLFTNNTSNSLAMKSSLSKKCLNRCDLTYNVNKPVPVIVIHDEDSCDSNALLKMNSSMKEKVRSSNSNNNYKPSISCNILTNYSKFICRRKTLDDLFNFKKERTKILEEPKFGRRWKSYNNITKIKNYDLENVTCIEKEINEQINSIRFDLKDKSNSLIKHCWQNLSNQFNNHNDLKFKLNKRRKLRNSMFEKTDNEITKKLLEDWSDEETKITYNDGLTINNKNITRKVNDELAKLTILANHNFDNDLIKSLSLPKIRNIPKKDRRNIVLQDFNNEIQSLNKDTLSQCLINEKCNENVSLSNKIDDTKSLKNTELDTLKDHPENFFNDLLAKQNKTDLLEKNDKNKIIQKNNNNLITILENITIIKKKIKKNIFHNCRKTSSIPKKYKKNTKIQKLYANKTTLNEKNLELMPSSKNKLFIESNKTTPKKLINSDQFQVQMPSVPAQELANSYNKKMFANDSTKISFDKKDRYVESSIDLAIRDLITPFEPKKKVYSRSKRSLKSQLIRKSARKSGNIYKILGRENSTSPSPVSADKENDILKPNNTGDTLKDSQEPKTIILHTNIKIADIIENENTKQANSDSSFIKQTFKNKVSKKSFKQNFKKKNLISKKINNLAPELKQLPKLIENISVPSTLSKTLKKHATHLQTSCFDFNDEEEDNQELIRTSLNKLKKKLIPDKSTSELRIECLNFKESKCTNKCFTNPPKMLTDSKNFKMIKDSSKRIFKSRNGRNETKSIIPLITRDVHKLENKNSNSKINEQMQHCELSISKNKLDKLDNKEILNKNKGETRNDHLVFEEKQRTDSFDIIENENSFDKSNNVLEKTSSNINFEKDLLISSNQNDLLIAKALLSLPKTLSLPASNLKIDSKDNSPFVSPSQLSLTNKITETLKTPIIDKKIEKKIHLRVKSLEKLNQQFEENVLPQKNSDVSMPPFSIKLLEPHRSNLKITPRKRILQPPVKLDMKISQPVETKFQVSKEGNILEKKTCEQNSSNILPLNLIKDNVQFHSIINKKDDFTAVVSTSSQMPELIQSVEVSKPMLQEKDTCYSEMKPYEVKIVDKNLINSRILDNHSEQNNLKDKMPLRNIIDPILSQNFENTTFSENNLLHKNLLKPKIAKSSISKNFSLPAEDQNELFLPTVSQEMCFVNSFKSHNKSFNEHDSINKIGSIEKVMQADQLKPIEIKIDEIDIDTSSSTKIVNKIRNASKEHTSTETISMSSGNEGLNILKPLSPIIAKIEIQNFTINSCLSNSNHNFSPRISPIKVTTTNKCKNTPEEELSMFCIENLNIVNKKKCLNFAEPINVKNQTPSNNQDNLEPFKSVSVKSTFNDKTAESSDNKISKTPQQKNIQIIQSETANILEFADVPTQTTCPNLPINITTAKESTIQLIASGTKRISTAIEKEGKLVKREKGKNHIKTTLNSSLKKYNSTSRDTKNSISIKKTLTSLLSSSESQKTKNNIFPWMDLQTLYDKNYKMIFSNSRKPIQLESKKNHVVIIEQNCNKNTLDKMKVSQITNLKKKSIHNISLPEKTNINIISSEIIMPANKTRILTYNIKQQESQQQLGPINKTQLLITSQGTVIQPQQNKSFLNSWEESLLMQDTKNTTKICENTYAESNPQLHMESRNPIRESSPSCLVDNQLEPFLSSDTHNLNDSNYINNSHQQQQLNINKNGNKINLIQKQKDGVNQSSSTSNSTQISEPMLVNSTTTISNNESINLAIKSSPCIGEEEIQTNKIMAVPANHFGIAGNSYFLCSHGPNDEYLPIDNQKLYLDPYVNQLVPMTSLCKEAILTVMAEEDAFSSSENEILQSSNIIKDNEEIPETEIDNSNSHQDNSNKFQTELLVGNREAEKQFDSCSDQIIVASIVDTTATMPNKDNASNIICMNVDQNHTQIIPNDESKVLANISTTSKPEPVAIGEDLLATEDIPGYLGPDQSIIIDIDGQQLILDQQSFLELAANGGETAQLETAEGQTYILSREFLAALGIGAGNDTTANTTNSSIPPITSDEKTQILQLHDNSNTNSGMVEVGLTGTEVYYQQQQNSSNDLINSVPRIETNNENIQQFVEEHILSYKHITSPVTAQTNETSALLTQPPIMSIIEVPSSKKLKQTTTTSSEKLYGTKNINENSKEINFGESDESCRILSTIVPQSIDDCIAFIGVSSQSPLIPSSLELPMTITNPAIAPPKSFTNPIQSMFNSKPLGVNGNIISPISTNLIECSDEDELQYELFTTPTSQRKKKIIFNPI